jgi:hypothetical protein
MEADDHRAFSIFFALLDCRYPRPKRDGRLALHYDEDVAEAHRVARAIVEALKKSRYAISLDGELPVAPVGLRGQLRLVQALAIAGCARRSRCRMRVARLFAA